MATITVADIKTRSRQKADMVNSNFIGDPEHLAYINEAWFAFYDLVVESFEDYNLQDPTPFTISSGSSTYDLPSDFYKLVGVDRSTGGAGEYYPLENYPWRSRNRYQTNFSRYGNPRVGYRLTGSKLRLVPENMAEGNYRLWYIPLATALDDDADTIERYNGFEELIVIDTAIKMLGKEESDVSLLLLERKRVEERMQRMLIDRDIANSDRIEEVHESFYDDDIYL